MSVDTPIISSNTLVDITYHNIRKDITEEYLPAGMKINLSDLCTRYAVSPTPIKQAMNRLLAEGLIESIPRKGCRVRNFSWSEVDELFELRMMMELHFAPQATAAVKTSPILRGKFESNIRENMALVESFQSADEYFRTYEIDQQFHELFILASGSRAALRMFKGLNTHAYATYLFGKQPRQQTINGIIEHQSIYDAMREGDTQQVVEKIRSHLENARNKIRLSLKLHQGNP